MILVKENNFSFKRNIICLISSIFICSCGGGGGGGNNLPVSELPSEQTNSKDTVNNLLPFADIIKAIETDEYFNQWGLSFINASSAYLLDATGKGSIVAVVDEALDWAHHEFLKANILHPDSALTYSGNREPTAWQKFHGTATVSIIAARKDSADIPSNMHGVAYDSQILFIATELGDPPADGEYVPTDIDKFDWSYYDAQEAKMYNNLSVKAQIVNNSFGFAGQITDYPKTTFANNFPKFIDTLGKNEDTIFVWSAGNYNGITDVEGNKVDGTDPGWLAGLGYYFPKLKDNNVAVVAIDQEGMIADFSNRCGVAKDFCIAAPGVRINVAIPNNLYVSLTEQEKSVLSEGVLNYLKDHPTEAYLLASGTSFAAPHVSGSLAVLFAKFGSQLSAKEILKRLFLTANKEGIYADEEIYGQGALDLGQAITPVGSISFFNSSHLSSAALPVSESFVITGKSFGDSLNKGLKSYNFSFFDQLAAPFLVPANTFFNAKIEQFSQIERMKDFQEKKFFNENTNGFFSFSSWDDVTNREGNRGLRLIDASIKYFSGEDSFSLDYGLNPSLNIFSYYEIDNLQSAFFDSNIFTIPWLKNVEAGYSATISRKTKIGEIKFNVYSGSKRRENWQILPSFLIPKEGKAMGGFVSFSMNKRKNLFDLTLGYLKEENNLLGNNSNGAFGNFKDEESLYISVLNRTSFSKRLDLLINVSAIESEPLKSNYYIQSISDLTELSFDIGFIVKEIFSLNESLTFRLYQEPRVEKGKIFIEVPIGRNYSGDVFFENAQFPLRPSGRELSFEAVWTKNSNDKIINFLLGVKKDKGNIKDGSLDFNMLFAFKSIF